MVFKGLLESKNKVSEESTIYGWNSDPGRFLVACDGEGNGCILAFVGHIELMFECGSKKLEDLGLDNAPEGLSIWEGSVVDTTYESIDGTDYDCELQGDFRKLTEDEWEAFRKGENLWDEKLWRTEKMKEQERVRELRKAAKTIEFSPLKW